MVDFTLGIIGRILSGMFTTYIIRLLDLLLKIYKKNNRQSR